MKLSGNEKFEVNLRLSSQMHSPNGLQIELVTYCSAIIFKCNILRLSSSKEMGQIILELNLKNERSIFLMNSKMRIFA